MADAGLRSPQTTEREVGDLLVRFVNRVSHSLGATLAVLSDAGVTLHQVLSLRALADCGDAGLTTLASRMHMSLPAMSQLVERLVQQGLASRAEAADDRRRKRLLPTARGIELLARIEAARSADYNAGVAQLAPATRAALVKALSEALAEL